MPQAGGTKGRFDFAGVNLADRQLIKHNYQKGVCEMSPILWNSGSQIFSSEEQRKGSVI